MLKNNQIVGNQKAGKVSILPNATHHPNNPLSKLSKEKLNQTIITNLKMIIVISLPASTDIYISSIQRKAEAKTVNVMWMSMKSREKSRNKS